MIFRLLLVIKSVSSLLLSFGYADFPTSKEANNAVKLSGTELYGRELRINLANSDRGGSRGGARGRGRGGGQGGGQRTPQGRKEQNSPSSTLFVKNLSFSTTEDSLYEHFEGCSRVRIVTDRESGESRG